MACLIQEIWTSDIVCNLDITTMQTEIHAGRLVSNTAIHAPVLLCGFRGNLDVFLGRRRGPSLETGECSKAPRLFGLLRDAVLYLGNIVGSQAQAGESLRDVDLTIIYGSMAEHG